MRIDRIYYPVFSLGPGQRIGIWTVGCHRACPGCSNPELWACDQNRDISVKELLTLIHSIDGSVDGFTLTGGEPFLQKQDLLELILALQHISSDILVYTGFEMGELTAESDPYITKILSSIAVLVDGAYMDELNNGCVLRGSSNQQIHILSDVHEKKYLKYLDQPRTMQNIMAKNTAISIGLPLRGVKQKLDKGLTKKGIVYKKNMGK